MTDISIPNFWRRELECPESKALHLHPNMVTGLPALRRLYNAPMNVSSGCRSATYNAAIGGAVMSYHRFDLRWRDGSVGTLAVDVLIHNGVDRARLAQLALNSGWSVGVAKWGLHLDLRSTIGDPQVLFGY